MPNDLVPFIIANPHVAVAFGVVFGELLIVLATRRDSPLGVMLTLSEITAFAAASTVLAAGALQGTFLTVRLSNVVGPSALLGYLIALLLVAGSRSLRPPEATVQGTLGYLIRAISGMVTLILAGCFFWGSLFLAAALP